MKKLLLLFSVLILGISACNNDDNKHSTEAPTIGLNYSTLTLSTGDTTTLVATIIAKTTPTAEFEWSSGDEDVVVVDENGFITAIAAGEATITASAMGADTTCNVTVNPSVYIIGSSVDASGDNAGIIWRNGSPLDTLTNSEGGNAYGEAIWVGEGDIFALYSLNYNSQSTPMSSLVTENGEIAVEYSDASNGYSCSDVVVYDNDIFTSGTISGSDNSTSAAYWSDNTLALLSLDSLDCGATSIDTDENGVYVGGYSNSAMGEMNAVVWINSDPITLSEDQSTVNDIAVNNEIIYAVGSNIDTATIWVNSEKIALDTTSVSSSALSLSVVGGDVYVAGFITNSDYAQVPVYWKNGVMTELGDGAIFGTANSIMVVGDNIYITGTTYSGPSRVATQWVNGNLTQLSDLSYSASGNSIFVR